MIQIIGFMIGIYIFTRMLDTAMRPASHVVVRVLAVLTMLADVLLLISLVAATATPGLGAR